MAIAQQEAPKWTDKIIVSSDGTAEENFIKTKQSLAEKGIEIASQDKDIFQIKTGDIPTQWGGTQYYVIFCKDKTIQITGNAKSGIKLSLRDADPYAPIVNRGMKGSILKESFKLMDSFAKTINGEIKYESSKVVIKEKHIPDEDKRN
jgi:hypothetical protein